MVMISNISFNFTNFCIIFFLTKALILGISSSTVVNSVFVARLLTSVILFSTAVKAVFNAKLPTSGILFSNSVSFVLLKKISYIRNFIF